MLAAPLVLFGAIAAQPADQAAASPWGECGRVEILSAAAPFSLKEGFVEVVPDTPLTALVFDAAYDDELVVELVRIGPLGKGRAKATIAIWAGPTRVLTILAPTLDTRPSGRAFASLPVRQRVPLRPDTSKLELTVDSAMGVRLSVEKRQAPTEIPLVPLSLTPLPIAPLAVTPLPTAPLAVTPLADVPVPAPAPAEPPPIVYPASPAVDAAASEPKAEATAHEDTWTPPTEPEAPAKAEEPWWPRLLAEVHAGSSLVFGGLQTFVPGGGARVLIGPRSLDAALGFAVDFDGQSAFVDAGRWENVSTKVRMDGHVGLGDLAMFEARLGLTLGAGARFATHVANLPGVHRAVSVVGATVRAAPEASVPAGPGRFVVELPVDVTFDVPAEVHGFAPVAAGVFLGYRLDL